MPFGVSAASYAYESLATLRPNTQTEDTTGQTINSFADSNTYKNIPCRIAPLVLIRPQHQEPKSSTVLAYEANWQVNLSVVIPLDSKVLSQYQIKVDGKIYQIKGIDADGSGKTMRLFVSDQVPYEE
jgi:hypothetical protein